MTVLEVRRLTPATVTDFWSVHRDDEGCGWCFCVAWWVPTWKAFPDRTEAENRALREGLFARGEHDGYVLTVDGEPAGWCQCGPRDRLPQLREMYGLVADPGVWAATCFVLRPAFRGRGLAHALLAGVVEDVRARGATRIQGFPRRGRHDAGEVWTGPEGVFVRAGFSAVAETPRGPVYERTLGAVDVPLRRPDGVDAGRTSSD